MLTALSGICNAGIDSKADTLGAFSFAILPKVERDLKICDLVKEENTLLTAKVVLVSVDRDQQRKEKEAAQADLKKEKRRRVLRNIVRTTLEVAVIVAIVIL